MDHQVDSLEYCYSLMGFLCSKVIQQAIILHCNCIYVSMTSLPVVAAIYRLTSSLIYCNWVSACPVLWWRVSIWRLEICSCRKKRSNFWFLPTFSRISKFVPFFWLAGRRFYLSIGLSGTRITMPTEIKTATDLNWFIISIHGF